MLRTGTRKERSPEHIRAGLARSGDLLRAIALLTLIVTLLSAGSAVGDQELSVSPTRIPITLDAGERTSASLTLTNRGEDELRLLPRVLAVTEDEGGKINLGEEEACGWVILGQGELLLEPLTERRVEVTVAPPAEAAPGMRRLAITFIEAPEGKGEIGVTGGLAVLLELDIRPANDAASSSFPVWLPVLSVTVFLLATGALLALQSHRKRRADREALADRGGGSGP